MSIPIDIYSVIKIAMEISLALNINRIIIRGLKRGTRENFNTIYLILFILMLGSSLNII